MDAPAKALVLGINNHNAFSSCTRCKVMGKSYGKRRSYQAQTSARRLHQDWLAKSDDCFFSGENCLADINGIDFATEVVLDHQHLICLGVMKKLLVNFWVRGSHKNKFAKLSDHDLKRINQRISYLHDKKLFPQEFAKYPRTLAYVGKWKATEFRAFILYLGPVVLKDILNSKAYEHFMRFHTAITILLSEVLCNKQNIAFADQQLRLFVLEFAELYGEDYVSHNVHGLIHLAEDAVKFGPLDNVAAFRFENHLGYLVSLVNKPAEAVQQVFRRIDERDQSNFTPTAADTSTKPSFSMSHEGGPLAPKTSDPQYRTVRFPHFTLSIQRPGDQCFMSRNHKVILLSNIASSMKDGSPKIIGSDFSRKEDFYQDPVVSSSLGIQEVSCLSKKVTAYDVEDIFLKCVILPFFLDPNDPIGTKLVNEDGLRIIFPMVHLGRSGNQKSSPQIFPNCPSITLKVTFTF
nr:PREDICTED: uncharacterized protein LOC109042047 [Bemisia tabaci]